MSIDTIPSYCYGTLSKKVDLQKILDEVKSWGTLPQGWRMSVADSSVYLINARRTKTLKIDIYRTVYTDRVLKNGIVVSSKHLNKSLDEAFIVAKQTFDSFTKSHESKIKREGGKAEGTPESTAGARGAEVRGQCFPTANPYWWVLV